MSEIELGVVENGSTISSSSSPPAKNGNAVAPKPKAVNAALPGLNSPSYFL